MLFFLVGSFNLYLGWVLYYLGLLFLCLFFSPKYIVPINIVLASGLNYFLAWKLHKKTQWTIVLYFLFGAYLCMPLGVYLIKTLDAIVLKQFIGVCIITIVILYFCNFKFSFKKNKLMMVALGGLSGILGGSVGLAGPPFIIYLSGLKLTSEHIRACCASFFSICSLFGLFLFIQQGLITLDTIQVSMIMVVPLCVGTFLGLKVVSFVKQNVFKDSLYLFLLCSGLFLLFGN